MLDLAEAPGPVLQKADDEDAPLIADAVQEIARGAVPEALVRFIGVSELAGAIGLILPAATRLRPWLTPLAALGLVTVMVLASLFHISRGEFFALPINLGFVAMASFIAWAASRRPPSRLADGAW